MRRRWSTRLEGGRCHSLIVDDGGRVIVSTADTVAADAPDGLSTWTSIEMPAATDDVRTTYRNVHAHGCHAVEPNGKVAWSVPKIVAKAESNGVIVATNDRGDVIMLDRAGATLSQTAVKTDSWSVIGWRGDEPIITPHLDTVWVEPFVYALHEHELRRCDLAGNVLEAIPIPRARFDAIRKETNLQWPDAMLFPPRFDLAYHAKLDRFVASHWSGLAWTMVLGRDGTIEQLALPTDACCNHVCVTDHAIVHASSCGELLTFLAMDLSVLATHRLEMLFYAFVDRGLVFARTQDAIHAFDLHGNARGTYETPGCAAAIARDGVLYVVSDELELVAYDVA